MKKVLSGLAVIVIGLGLAACGGDDSGTVASDNGSTTSTTAASTAAHENTVSVAASGFAFEPKTATAKAGTVFFDITNKDDTKHTFTIDNTKVDIELDPMGSGTAEADLAAGTYTWHCKIHSTMTGTLTVS